MTTILLVAVFLLLLAGSAFCSSAETAYFSIDPIQLRRIAEKRPAAGERPIWYGGGNIARDLTLPRLRDGWPDTPTGASEAA